MRRKERDLCRQGCVLKLNVCFQSRISFDSGGGGGGGGASSESRVWGHWTEDADSSPVR